MRIYEFVQSLSDTYEGIDSKVITTLARELGYGLQSAQSSIDDNEKSAFLQFFGTLLQKGGYDIFQITDEYFLFKKKLRISGRVINRIYLYSEFSSWRKMFQFLNENDKVYNETAYFDLLEHRLGKGVAGKKYYTNQEVKDIMSLFFDVFGGSSVTSEKKEGDSVATKKVNASNSAIKRRKDMSNTDKWISIINELMFPQMPDNSEEEYTPKKITDYTLNETDYITVPNKMDFYTELDITEKDNLIVEFSGSLNNSMNSYVMLVNGDDYIVGLFEIHERIVDQELVCFLTASNEYLRFDGHNNSKYYLVFAENSASCKMYRVPIEVSYQKTETTNTHLCIDFGTSNTTVGCFLDNEYVGNVSNLAVINENVKLNDVNITKFADVDDGVLSYSELVPTVVYVDKVSQEEKYIDFLFGYEAEQKVKEDNYCPKSSCFMEIKRWTSNIKEIETVEDEDGNIANVSREDIIHEYLKFIIRSAENQFKCKFKNIHISAPVKLKEKVLDIYSEILEKDGYVLEIANAIDEGICVLYSIINNQIKDGNYENGEKEKALIIDCGGGTSDLASCSYVIDKDEDGIINLDVKTEYMNGDVNFGGNNLTYRIMQFMKIVYAVNYTSNKRIGIDDLISNDTNSIFSDIEGELENDNDDNVKQRYEDVYKNLNESYEKAEEIIPTRYKDYENKPSDVYNKVKNNFYFLWNLAEEMKEEFYRSTSISRYTFEKKGRNEDDIDLHVNNISNWRLSIFDGDSLKEQRYPKITFTAKEIDKLLRADIYYLVRKFLNDLYINKTLDEYSQIKLSGQSSKISIFMESLKEFLPGKKIKSGRIHSKGNDAEELKLLCLRGAITYLHALEKSNIEIAIENDTKNIPISVYIMNENNEAKDMFKQGDDWEQKAVRRRITTGGKEVYLHMRNIDKEIGQPYKYVYENIKWESTTFEKISNISHKKIEQEAIDNLPQDKKYIFVFLNKDKWGFDILPVYRDKNGKLFKGPVEFCSFEMDILQETYFDGRK